MRPSPEAFRALAREYTVVPVWREVLADFETPLSAYAKLVGDREGFLLESVEHAERWGRFSFLGRDPARTFVTRGRTVEWVDGHALRDGFAALALRARPHPPFGPSLAARERGRALFPPQPAARRSKRRATAWRDSSGRMQT